MLFLSEKKVVKENTIYSVGIFQENQEKYSWHYHDYYELVS